MSKRNQRPDGAGRPGASDPKRAALADALRENLKRRKAQAAARAAQDAPGAAAEPQDPEAQGPEPEDPQDRGSSG
ncbi:MAG: hypothetical protein AAGM38_05170 [Pseudomonadota bacterium]